MCYNNFECICVYVFFRLGEQTMLPLISIVIPVYNAEKYLSACIDSVLCQTYSNLEIILVNDGSTDTCPALCEDFAKKDKRIVVIHKENGGVSSARNQGLQSATGEYVGFIDSDDYVDKDYVQALYDSLQTENSDIAFCNFVYAGKSIQSSQENLPNTVHIDANSPETIRFLGRFFRVGSYIMSSSCRTLYKKQLVKDLRFNPLLRVGEDLLFVIQALLKAQTASFVKRDLYFYRVNEESCIHNYKNNYLQNQTDLYTEIKNCFADYNAKKLLNVYGAVVNYECFLNEIKYKQETQKENIQAIRKSELYKHFTLKNGLCIDKFNKKIKYVIVWFLVKTRLV